MAPQFEFQTTGQQVVDALPEQVKGRTFVITGTSDTGIGANTAIDLASAHPAALYLLARTESKVTSVIKKINEIDPSIKAVFVQIDLSDFDTVRAAASKIQSSTDKIDVLINNAGVMAPRNYQVSKSGIEIQFAANHLGHFLLTALLIPQILAAGKGSRIVNLSSIGHEMGGVIFDDYNFSEGKKYDAWVAYGQSKTSNVLFSLELAKRLASRGIFSFAVHPGSIYESNLAGHMDEEDFANFTKKVEQFNMKLDPPKTREQGCSTSLMAALDPRLEEKPEDYIYMADCNIREVKPWAVDPENAAKLWTLSEELVGQKFDL